MIDEVGGKFGIQLKMQSTMKVLLAGRNKVTCGMTVDLHRGSIMTDSRWKKIGSFF